jgi:hypothetical protein
LFTLDENGGLASEYVGNLGWRTFERSGSEDQLEAVAT